MSAKFTEKVGKKSDHFYVHEDPARIYRGLRDLLVEEFNMDEIEENKMEFSTSAPKDRIRMKAYKLKSPYTEIEYKISWKAKSPKWIYKYDRPDDILKARVETSAKVITHYPRHAHAWEPHEHSSWHESKFYEMLVGFWYHKFYHKEIHRYQEEAAETMKHLHNLMREKFGVEKTIERTGASHYHPPWS